MVRESRFASNDEMFPDDPPFADDFDERDDAFLDGFSPSDRSPKRTRKKRGSTGSGSDSKRHLADGDWLKPGRSPKRKSRKKKKPS